MKLAEAVSPLIIDVSHNSGGSKTVFSGVFSVFATQNRGFSIANRRSVSGGFAASRTRIAVCVERGRFENRRNYRPKIDRVRHKIDRPRHSHDTWRHSHDTWRHFHDTSRHIVNSDLRRIVSDFLTVRNRVGDAETHRLPKAAAIGMRFQTRKSKRRGRSIAFRHPESIRRRATRTPRTAVPRFRPARASSFRTTHCAAPPRSRARIGAFALTLISTFPTDPR